MEQVSIKGQRFYAGGREVLFNGINLVEKDPALGHITPGGAELFAALRNHGINLVRYGVFWSAVEPAPGQFDDAYLAQVKAQVALAAAAGIYVYLDFHQDLYGEKFGNGAPLWATLDDDLPHTKGQLWSDTYQLSAGLNRAIDHFWANAPAADGQGLQDHYVAMVAHVAAAFRDDPTVIGFDLHNEPYPGSAGAKVAEALIGFFSQHLQLAPAELMQRWLDDQAKQSLLASLKDPATYEAAVTQLAPVVQAFERDVLQPFYARLEAAILPHTGQFAFLETSFFNNIGIPTGLTFAHQPHEVFAPHAYDLVVDTKHFENYDTARLERTLAIHRAVQIAQDVPLVLGEWGAYFQDPATRRISEVHVARIEQYLWSHTYWSYYDGYFDSPTAAVLNRPYPQAIAGTLAGYHYDYATGAFTLAYAATAGGTSLVYVPNLAKVDLAPLLAAGLTVVKQPDSGSTGGRLALTAAAAATVNVTVQA